MTDRIVTDHLFLELLSIDFLDAAVVKDLQRAKRLVDFNISNHSSFFEHGWISQRLKKIIEDSSQHPWMYRAIVTKKENEMIGFICFHHKYPDPDLRDFSNNGVELGYTIESDHRRKGYAKESVLSMIKWAEQKTNLIDIFVTVSPDNLPSMALAQSLGFLKVGEHQDDIDGLEYVMRYPNYNKTGIGISSRYAPRNPIL